MDQRRSTITLFHKQNDMYNGERLRHSFFGFGSARMKLARRTERRRFGGDDNQAFPVYDSPTLFSCPIALMHVTSWSESYPLRNSLMGVRGSASGLVRLVFVQSFHLSAFVLKRPALLALERQSQEMRFFSPPKTTSVGRLFEGETQALNEEVTLACR